MTSINKKANNYSSIIGDIKAAVLLEKTKGRNIKMIMKRVQANSLDKGDLVGVKSTQGSSGMNPMNMSTLYLNEKHQISTDGLPKGAIFDKRIIDKRRIVSNDYGKKNPDYNCGNVSINNENKIDIKISVNYGKSGGNAVPKPGNISCSMMNSQSKSFYCTNGGIKETKLTNPKGIQYGNKNVELTAKDNNSHTPPIPVDNKFLTSLNSEDKMFKKKIIDNKEPCISNSNSFSSNSNAHKRNTSDANYFNNNLSISLMNYNHKPQISNSLNYTIENHEENTVILDTAHKNDQVKTINHSEVSLNNNDNEILKNNDKITNTEITSPLANPIPSPGISSSSTNKNQLLILNTQLMEMLKGVENSDKRKERDKNEALGKKYSIYKTVIDEMVRISYPEEKDILSKIRNGIDEIINALMARDLKMNARLRESEEIMINYKKVNKKYSELYKAYQEKIEEMNIMKGRMTILEKEKELMKSKQDTEKEQTLLVTNTITTIEQPENNNINTINENSSFALNTLTANPEQANEKNTITDLPIKQKMQSRMSTMIDQQGADDLESLYFFDKIDMRAHSVSHAKIPRLDLNFSQNKTKKRQEGAPNQINVVNITYDISKAVNKSSNNVGYFHNLNGRNLSYCNSHLNSLSTNLNVKKAEKK